MSGNSDATKKAQIRGLNVSTPSVIIEVRDSKMWDFKLKPRIIADHENELAVFVGVYIEIKLKKTV